MARGRAAVMSSDDPDRSYPESSPDPLNASINGNALKSRRKPARASQEPLRTSSPNKSNRRTSISEVTRELSSPSKVMVMNTPRSGGASPWRIKVTVQAEPGSGDTSDIENESSPIVQRMTRTTTTTIPLKDDNASSPVKRRGRPRKSDATPSAKTKRSATPVRKRSQSKGRRKSTVGVSDTGASDPPADAPPKRRRGRPRKTLQPEDIIPLEDVAQDEMQPGTETTGADTGLASESPSHDAPLNAPEVNVTSVTPSAPSGQLSIPIIQTTDATPQTTPVPKPLPQGQSLMLPVEQTKGRRRRAIPEYEEPIMFDTPPETDLSRRIKARRRTPHAKVVATREESSDDDSYIDTPSGTDEEVQVQKTQTEIVLIEEQIQPPENETLPVGEEEEEQQDVTSYAFDEGVTRMPDDTTIIDSENFSMISVDSLPSSGGFTSPPAQQLPSSPATRQVPSVETVLDQSYLQIPSGAGHTTQRSPPNTVKSSPRPSQAATSSTEAQPMSVQQRHKTPVMDSRSPSNPPAIEQARASPTEAQTPKIGRVVKAGVALQGVLDPERMTPTESSKAPAADERLARLDDLFRGFSEGTRKELQAGLRLGEELAKQKHHRWTSEQSGPSLSSPIKQNTKTNANDVFLSSTKQRTSRLLTPEDQDEYTLPAPPPPQSTDINYPSLQMNEQVTQLVSPARSEDEMSWRVDTPPVTVGVGGSRSFITAVNEQGEEIRGSEIYVVADAEEQEQEQEDYQDIWQEEASRSSVEQEPLPQPQAKKTAQVDDLFPNEVPKPARSKLPKTWRRTSGSDFQYSDEAEEPVQEPTPSSSEEPDQPAPRKVDKGKGKIIQPAIPEESDNVDDDIGSEASDDTGMFFQSNLPNLFNRGRTAERRKRRAERSDHSSLAEEGQSLLPDSSPVRPAGRRQNVRQANGLSTQSPAVASSPPELGSFIANKDRKPEHSLLLDNGHSLLPESSPAPRAKPQSSHPFIATPPRIAAIQTSPAKGSPLRQEIRISSSPSFHQSGFQEESTLPLPQSSPFHTQVDNTYVSAASDERQFRQEMEGHTDSSIRLIREEADAHLNAYETQYRTLNDVTEVTEPSRSAVSASLMPSSPPKRTSMFQGRRPRSDRSQLLDDAQSVLPESSHALEDSILRPWREYSPLFGDEVSAISHMKVQRPTRKAQEEPVIARAPPTEESPEPASGGIFGRLTSAIWGARAAPAPSTAPAPRIVVDRYEIPEVEMHVEQEPNVLPHHPALRKHDPLPRTEPWTKSHYKTLDALYQRHKKRPATFALSHSSNSETNYTLLEHFLEDEKKPFVGAAYSSWGYGMEMSESLVVLCAAYMQLLSLDDIEEYENVNGKKIEMGDCAPGIPGDPITGFEVARRLASVVMGEELRSDEKKGVPIDRSGGMTITWPMEY